MKGRKHLAIWACLLCLFLAGCGGREETAVQEEDAISDYYTLEVIPLDAEVRTVPYPLIVDREIYWTVPGEGNVCVLRRMNIDDREAVSMGFSLERPYNLLEFTVDSEGSLYYLLTVKWDPAERGPDSGSKKWDMYLMKRNADGEEVFYRKIAGDLPDGFYKNGMWVDEEGRICFRQNGQRGYQLHLFDAEGQYLGVEEHEYDQEEMRVHSRQIASLEKFGFQSKDVKQIAFLEDGRIAAEAGNWDTGFHEIVVLTPSQVPFRGDAQELVLGMLQGNSMVKGLAADFNKSREDVYVKIKEYQPSGSPRTAAEAVSALMGDILAGKGPDLVAFPPGEELGVLAAQGVMEDLGPYVEESRMINREDYLPAVWELGAEGDLLYGIPMRFGIQTLAGKAFLLGGREGWTAGDFLAFAQAHPESLPIDGCSKSRILSLCILFQAEEYLDREAGVSCFGVPEFREIMEFADTFAPDESPVTVADEWKYRDGSVLLMEADLYDVESCLRVYQAFGEEALSFPGYPSGDGGGGHRIARCNWMYGITSGSAHKQEAWAFVEHAVERDAESGRVMGFPARREDLEVYLDRELERLGLGAGTGTSGVTEPEAGTGTSGAPGLGAGTGASGVPEPEAGKEVQEAGNGAQRFAEELKKVVFTLAGQAVAETGWESEEAGILIEETASYFGGRKSLDETIKVLENRMNLLLKEQETYHYDQRQKNAKKQKNSK